MFTNINSVSDHHGTVLCNSLVNTYIPQIARDVQFKPNLFLGMDLNAAPDSD